MKTYKFKNCKIRIEKCQYPNGRTALEFTDARNGALLFVPTVDMPDIDLLAKEILIKSWGDNEGVLEFLIDEGIISRPIRTVPIGRYDRPIQVVNLLKEDFK